MRPSAQCEGYVSPSVAANSIWKFFLKSVMLVKVQFAVCSLKFAVSRASLIFHKRFPDAVSNFLKKSLHIVH